MTHLAHTNSAHGPNKLTNLILALFGSITEKKFNLNYNNTGHLVIFVIIIIIINSI